MIARIKCPVTGCLACVGGLVLVRALAYKVGSFERLDASVLSRLSADEDSFIGSAATFAVHLADPLPQIALLTLVCLSARRWGRPRHGIAAVVLVAGANLTTQVLKVILSHPRYQLLLGPDQVPSTAFPSGHSTAAMAMALAFVLVVPPTWRSVTAAIGACLVAAVGCSAVILHRHYPSDVLGGLLVATGWFFAVLAGLRALDLPRSDREAPMRRKPADSPTLPPGACARRAAAAGRRGR